MSRGVHLDIQFGTKWGPEGHLNRLKRPKGLLGRLGAVLKASGWLLEPSWSASDRSPEARLRLAGGQGEVGGRLREHLRLDPAPGERHLSKIID